MRRGIRVLALASVLAAVGVASGAVPSYPDVVPGNALNFPADEGAHPPFRTEWWYVTGWLKTAAGAPLGFQVTFFRTRPDVDAANPSAFAARELVIAHAALSDPAAPRAKHAERIARAVFGLARAAVGRTDVTLGDWQLVSSGALFATRVKADDFAFELTLRRRGPVLLNGQGGFSRKGPAETSASWYYSIPGLAVTGALTRNGRPEPVTGEAWLDHEWSSAYLDPESVGWDWLGLNLDDGGALMAFRIRDAKGQARWAGGSLRSPDGRVLILEPGEVDFVAGRTWRSPHTGIRWPVEWRVRARSLEFGLRPLLDDQESDSRLTTGAVYWEGAVTAMGPAGRLGRGYLELTGYGEPLKLR